MRVRNCLGILAVGLLMGGSIALAIERRSQENVANPSGPFEGVREATISGGAGVSDVLSNVLQFDEKLPKAVCDESVVSRPPSLEAYRDSPTGELKPTHPVELRVRLKESELISFLLGAGESVVASDQLHTLFKSLEPGTRAEAWPMARRRVALEFCGAMLSPQKLRALLLSNPSPFLTVSESIRGQLKRVKETASFATESPSGATLELRDVQGRFGWIDRSWRIAGWIEPSEVVAIEVGSRRYYRLANPITNQARYVLVQAEDGTPLAFLFPSSEPQLSSWNAALALAGSKANRQRKLEIYRLMMESEAYQALSRAPARSESIRKLQEYYKNLMSAYEIYPEDLQFTKYAQTARRGGAGLAKRGPGIPSRSPSAELGLITSSEAIMDDTFFRALKSARVNGASVGINAFLPDPSLQAMYHEYLGRLQNQ